MAEFDKIVNSILDRFDRSIASADVDSKRFAAFTKERDALASFIAELKHLRSITRPIPQTLGDLSDLPDELKAELSAIKTDDLENQIFTIINAAGGEANIDTILIELFRRFDVVQKRTYITNKLWRMTQKEGLIWAAEGKGYYTTTEPASPLHELRDNIETVRNHLTLDDEIPF